MSLKKIHFLHIPKTAGQSVHQLLINAFDNVSPLRLNDQYNELGFSSVSDFDVISGHIDWSLMKSGGEAEFTFTVLRKPVDRILSFYHYLRTEAKKLSEAELAKPERVGMYNALIMSPNDYFCSRDVNFKTFINNHYDNFYCYFFASLSYQGHALLKEKSNDELIGLAINNLSKVNRIYTLDNLAQLPLDLRSVFKDKKFEPLPHVNKGDSKSSAERLVALKDIGDADYAIKRIEQMCKMDNIIYDIVSRC
jgi:hypothetical protein